VVEATREREYID
jgi:hypothetical protein